MKIGITGTRTGTTKEQYANLRLYLLMNERYITEFHHGSCKGVDEEAHDLLAATKVSRHVWPSNNTSTRVDVPIRDLDFCHEVAQPLTRNRDIVNSVDLLIAFPKLMHEEQRSGTWAAIRYARKQELPVTIYWPDGSMTQERRDG
jgi:hypothetical protein